MRLVHFLTTKGFIVGIIVSTIVSCKVLETPQNTQQVDPIDKIIASMSIEEKVGQTCQVTLDVILQPATTGGDQIAKIDTASLKEALITYKVGSVLNVGSHTLSRAEWSTVINAVKAPYNSGRIKIPVIYGIDAIHGMNYTVGGTLFPQEIGLAATWNKALVEACASTTAYEVRASGIPWNFSPVLDLGRQPLWSRHFETLGEDPYLCSELGAAMIKGYQGKDGVDQEHVAACMKHFVGYSAATSGRDRTPAWIPNKYMRELYLPSFEKAVKAGALTVMINSGVVNGIPGHINKYLLTDVLKKEMGFDGFAVSDWEDFIMLHTVHRTSETLEKAYVAAFNAGVDMSMVPLSPQYKEYCSVMINAVKRGDISMERLDDAVRRILRVKMKVGLFEKDVYNPEAFKEFGSETFKKKALDAALESITLLKNSADILPLDKKKKVLVAGPVADNLVYLNGAWTHTWQGVDQSYNTPNRPTVKQAFEAYLGKENVLYAQGAELILKDGFETTRLLDTADYRSKLAQCDVVVLCLGEMPSTEKPGDIHSLNMDREQMLLAEMAYKMKKSVVLVLLEGRPRIIRDIVDQASAIIQCYLPGDFGAEALVKLAYGEHNFSGKLPYTYPKYDGVIEFYDHPRSVDRSKSGDFKAYDPQWDFGYGLSYSNVSYSPLTLSKNEMKGKESLTVAVKVSNVSTRKVHEIIQLYVTDEFATLVPAGKRLRRFEKVELLPGQTKEVSFELNDQDLIFYDNQERPQIEPGKFTLSIKEQNISFIYTE